MIRATLPRYAYVDTEGIVVNIIVGHFTADDEALFLEQQREGFGAVDFIKVDHSIRVTIGCRYDRDIEQFIFPEAPQPEIVEPMPDPEGVTNADPAIE